MIQNQNSHLRDPEGDITRSGSAPSGGAGISQSA